MNKRKIGVLVAAIVFTTPSQASFDQLGVTTFSFYGDASDFVSDELRLLPLIQSDFEVREVLALIPASKVDVDDPVVSLSASAVPVPSAVWFFGSALVALTVIQRRA